MIATDAQRVITTTVHRVPLSGHLLAIALVTSVAAFTMRCPSCNTRLCSSGSLPR